MREGERVRVGERGRERGREGERGGEREREEREGKSGRERGRGRVQKRIHMHMQVHSHTYNKQTCTHTVSCTVPTLREISVTTRADKVFLMPAQVLGSDTWLQRERGRQRERETEREGINRNTILKINWNITETTLCGLLLMSPPHPPLLYILRYVVFQTANG